MSTVSAIVVTRHPCERVIELLATVRAAVDEIVLAVDDRAGEAGLGAVEGLADTIALFHFGHSIERQWEWIASLASSKWILWLDDDELPSPALVAAIPRLVEAPDVTHYLVRRVWVWPEPGTMLVEPPWDPDFSPRLYRSDQALAWYPGLLHVPVKQVGPFRLVDEPLYHVDLVDNTERDRREKATRYERLRPGLRAAGLPQNQAVYVPESRGRPPATAPLPASARDAVERFVACSREAIGDAPPSRPILRGTRDVIDAAYRGEPGSLRDTAVVSFAGRVDPALAGIELSVEVLVENLGSGWWPPAGFGISDVFISYRWYGRDGSVVVDGGLRTPLPVGVPPGGRERVLIDVVPPSMEGRYTLGVDLVREHVHWFGCEERIDVDVRHVPTVGILVDPGDAAVAVELAAALTELVPEARPVLLARDPGSTGAATGYAADADPMTRHLQASSLRLLLAACRASRPEATEAGGTELDIVVVTGMTRLSGSAGRREALALAAVLRRLARQDLRILSVGPVGSAPRGLAGRVAGRALRLVDRDGPAERDAAGVASSIGELLRRNPPAAGATDGLP